MTFRADESAQEGFEKVKNYLFRQSISVTERMRSEEKLHNIIKSYGPVVESYPSWHPLISNHNCRRPEHCPSDQCGYSGLDHTIYFRNAFLTCPYNDESKVIDSVDQLPYKNFATISAERLDFQFYAQNAKPILVTCDWNRKLELDGTIPAALAVPLMLSMELPCWESAQLGETWESMRFHFLGSPHGKRSSLFINQQTGQHMKKIWNLLINTGMYGPIKG